MLTQPLLTLLSTPTPFPGLWRNLLKEPKDLRAQFCFEIHLGFLYRKAKAEILFKCIFNFFSFKKNCGKTYIKLVPFLSV